MQTSREAPAHDKSTIEAAVVQGVPLLGLLGSGDVLQFRLGAGFLCGSAPPRGHRRSAMEAPSQQRWDRTGWPVSSACDMKYSPARVLCASLPPLKLAPHTGRHGAVQIHILMAHQESRGTVYARAPQLRYAMTDIRVQVRSFRHSNVRRTRVGGYGQRVYAQLPMTVTKETIDLNIECQHIFSIL